jgi:hypothetical protein
MTLVTNPDLMRMEPNLFTDAANSGLTLLNAIDAAVSGDTISSAGSDFTASGVSVNEVAVVNGEPVEILVINSATSMDVSRRRGDLAAPTLQPVPGSGLTLTILSFDLLLEQHETWVLDSLDINPSHPTQPIDVVQILNLEEIKRLIALHVIAQAFARSSALDPPNESLEAMAAWYALQAEESEKRLVARIDLDGDGQADLARRLDASRMVRV